MNVHGTALTFASCGFLIQGPSGSGKTALALAAITEAGRQGRFAALVADDQCLIEVANGRVIASCPPVLRGLAEMRGLGIITCDCVGSAVIDGVIRLVEANTMERMPPPQTTRMAGIEVPVFECPARQIVISLPILMQLTLKLRF